MRELVNHILAVADEHGLEITNLQLQKILYFSLIEALRRRIFTRDQLLEIYTQPFLVWRYGPVVEEIYEEYKTYGSTSILEKGKINPEITPLNSFIIALLKKPPFYLVEVSHNHSKWLENEEHILYGRSNVPYTIDDLISEANNEQASI